MPLGCLGWPQDSPCIWECIHRLDCNHRAPSPSTTTRSKRNVLPSLLTHPCRPHTQSVNESRTVKQKVQQITGTRAVAAAFMWFRRYRLDCCQPSCHAAQHVRHQPTPCFQGTVQAGAHQVLTPTAVDAHPTKASTLDMQPWLLPAPAWISPRRRWSSPRTLFYRH